MRRCLTQFVFAAAMTLPLPALAQNCPPGAWFCEATEPQEPPAPVQTAPQRQAPPPPQVVVEEPEQPGDALPPPPARPSAEPPVVIYQPVPQAPPQTRVIIIAPGYGHGAYYGPPARPVRALPPPPPRPPAPKYHWQSEWGLNLRVEGMTFGHGNGAAFGSGMGGVGASLRYRPIPAFAFDFGVDLMAGTDYNGFERTELPVTLSGMLFLNPRSRAQFYLIGGMNYSHAQVKSDFGSPLLTQQDDGTFGADYTYFGGHGGLGLELRLSRHVAINIDGIGFGRKRIDNGKLPEFYDAQTGRTTNTSGGGIFRGGVTFWW
jgi:opacity protein-like surface antigen